MLTSWDRLFGAYRELERQREEPIEIGLREVRDSRASSLWWLLVSPLVQLEKQLDNSVSGIKQPGS